MWWCTKVKAPSVLYYETEQEYKTPEPTYHSPTITPSQVPKVFSVTKITAFLKTNLLIASWPIIGRENSCTTGLGIVIHSLFIIHKHSDQTLLLVPLLH